MATNLSNLDKFLKGDITPPIKEAHDNKQTRIIEEIICKAKSKNINTVPLDIREVVKHIFNINIIEMNLGKVVSGFIGRLGTEWTIYINSDESEMRKRFILAHELGHFIFHRDKYAKEGTSAPDRNLFKMDVTNPIEKEANSFAMELMMPSSVFFSYIKDGANTLGKISDKFNLPTYAVRVKAEELGLIQ